MSSSPSTSIHLFASFKSILQYKHIIARRDAVQLQQLSSSTHYCAQQRIVSFPSLATWRLDFLGAIGTKNCVCGSFVPVTSTSGPNAKLKPLPPLVASLRRCVALQGSMLIVIVIVIVTRV